LLKFHCFGITSLSEVTENKTGNESSEKITNSQIFVFSSGNREGESSWSLMFDASFLLESKVMGIVPHCLF